MDNIAMVLAELDAAKRKHRRFVHVLFGARSRATEEYELTWKRDLLRRRFNAQKSGLEDVLLCEVQEARLAYSEGDLPHARQELAQCAAVCIRAMEMIEEQIEAREKKE